MQLRNPFSQDTRKLFFYNYECFYCLENNWDALHHVLGRVSDSPLNACPIHNHKCHIGNSKLDSFEMRSKLLKKTISYLREEGYILTDKDKQFISKYEKYYA